MKNYVFFSDDIFVGALLSSFLEGQFSKNVSKCRPKKLNAYNEKIFESATQMIRASSARNAPHMQQHHNPKLNEKGHHHEEPRFLAW